ncbi:MAG: 7-carboxy-7-deazaguanine synthase [Gemmatimonadaceae bacterium]
MAYTVKECFYTLQGEGMHAGRPAVFLRFSGCNLWTGREEDRHSAVCSFCDTDFVGIGPDGGRFKSPDDLAAFVKKRWPLGQSGPRVRPFVVCTGGEPLLQLDDAAIEALHAIGFTVAVETNGTQVAPAGIDWTCVSPKANADLVLTAGDELKLVYPQPLAMPERFAGLDFQHFRLQPMDGPNIEANTRAALEYCLKHPQWSLSIQTHKLLQIR